MDESDRAIVARLVDEIERLRASAPDGEPALTFGAGPFTAYAVVAALQLALHHPSLSGLQRQMIESFAHQVADVLTYEARAQLGPDSTIEQTLAAGFDPAQDRSPGGSPVDPYAELDDDEGFDQEDDEPPDSYVLGDVGAADIPALEGRRCRYVEPSFLITNPGEQDMELSKCARCGRFFLMAVPLRLFAGEGDDVLGMEICEACSPAVFGRVRSGG